MNKGFCRTDAQCGELLKYLLVKTAPVIHGIKPSVLLRLNNCPKLRNGGHYETFCLNQNEILQKLKLQCRIMKRNTSDILVMFYEPQILWEQLSKSGHKQFLDRHGYWNCHELAEYLDELHRRFGQGGFPHEIGVFLGYPLKDVAGYMANRGDYVEIPRGLWRVFGDPEESARIMDRYRYAEETMRQNINRHPDINSFINHYHRTA